MKLLNKILSTKKNKKYDILIRKIFSNKWEKYREDLDWKVAKTIKNIILKNPEFNFSIAEVKLVKK